MPTGEIIYYSTASKYVGEIDRFVASGIGCYITEAFTYEGSFLNDLFDGYGVITFKENNAQLKGCFKNGECYGKCKARYSNGYEYEGYFNRNIFISSDIYPYITMLDNVIPTNMFNDVKRKHVADDSISKRSRIDYDEM